MRILSEALKPIEAILNKGFRGSSKAQSIGAEHNQKVLALYVANPAFSVYLRVTDSGLDLMDDYESEPNASVGGTLVALSKMVQSDAEKTIRQQGIIIEGDAGFAQAMQSLFGELRPDPEEELSKLVGDVAAHQVGRAVSGVMTWSMNAFEAMSQNFGEFVSEESRDVPTRYEAELFMREVDELRNDVDRMIARFNKLL